MPRRVEEPVRLGVLGGGGLAAEKIAGQLLGLHLGSGGAGQDVGEGVPGEGGRRTDDLLRVEHVDGPGGGAGVVGGVDEVAAVGGGEDGAGGVEDGGDGPGGGLAGAGAPDVDLPGFPVGPQVVVAGDGTADGDTDDPALDGEPFRFGGDVGSAEPVEFVARGHVRGGGVHVVVVPARGGEPGRG